MEREVTKERGKEVVGRVHVAGALSLARTLSGCVRWYTLTTDDYLRYGGLKEKEWFVMCR